MIKLSEIHAALQAASPEPWEWFASGDWSREKVREFMLANYDAGEQTELHGIQIQRAGQDDKSCVAITGNGPTSEANAKFMRLARAALPALLEAVESMDAFANNSEFVRVHLRHAGIEVDDPPDAPDPTPEEIDAHLTPAGREPLAEKGRKP